MHLYGTQAEEKKKECLEGHAVLADLRVYDCSKLLHETHMSSQFS